MSKRSSLRILLFATVCFLTVFSKMASAAVLPAEVESYSAANGVSALVAQEHLEIQHRGVNIVQHLEESLGSDYAGVWFDPNRGEFVVPVTSGSNRGAVASQMAKMGLTGAFRFQAVKSSWDELKNGLAAIDSEVVGSEADETARTGLDPRLNAVEVQLPSSMSASAGSELKRISHAAGITLVVDEVPGGGSALATKSCIPTITERYCSIPFRGGVGISQDEYVSTCTAAFRARDLSTGRRYVITAGHCVGDKSINEPTRLSWGSGDANAIMHHIGNVSQWSFPGDDWAKIDATGSYWDQTTWPARIVLWGENNYNQIVQENYEINGEETSYLFQTVCHSGLNTGTSCGTVVGTDMTLNYGGEDWVKHMTLVSGGCVGGGDSGGSVYANHMALGILSGGSPSNEHLCSEREWAYSNIKEATAALGVKIAPLPPIPASSVTVTAKATALMGQPGWAAAGGNVSTNGVPIANATLNVNFQKLEGSTWVPKYSVHPVTDGNGNWGMENYLSTGTGEWRVRAVLPTSESYEEAASVYDPFRITEGVRLVALHSGKCADVYFNYRTNGAAVHQWECLDPATYQSQVWSLSPVGSISNGYYTVFNRNSGRCLDVVNGETGNGALLQQWSCNGLAQQHWRKQAAETVEGTQYWYLIAQHSQRCLDVPNGSTENGVRLQQWDCVGTRQMKWKMEPVTSAPVKTELSATVETLPGEYGWVSVHGYLQAGGYGFGGQHVQVTYEKLINSNWTTIETKSPEVNGSGYFEQNFVPEGVGQWRLHVDWGGGGTFAGSSSGYRNYWINRGYRFINRKTGKCMSVYNNQSGDGVAIVQRTCNGFPSSMDGQVFTLVPFENGKYFELLINSHSTSQLGACVDVAGASTANGALLQQWDCGNGSGANQLFQPAQINGEQWYAFIAKHSGKCIDVKEQLMYDNVNLHQWECFWGGSQQWRKEEIG